jgi:hypothetical protein
MDKHLNSDEIQLQSLLETKDFEALSAAERKLVLSMLTEKEYALQRSILKESPFVYPQESDMVVPPLVMTSEAATSFWFKKAPVYQTMLAVAATILFMFLISKPQTPIIQEKVVKEYVTQIDTVVETKFINDTVFQYIDKPIIIEKVKYVEVPSSKNASATNTYASNVEPERVLEPSMNVSLPDFNEPTSSSVANSYKNDPTSILVGDFVLNK